MTDQSGNGSGGAAEPLTLPGLEPEPKLKLTERQAVVLGALERAGANGLYADEAGAIAHALKEGRWAHGPDERCVYCGRDGLALLKRLRDLGFARYRGRMRVWQAVDSDQARSQPHPAMLRDDEPIPY